MNNLKIIDLLYKYRNLKKIGLSSEDVNSHLNNLLFLGSKTSGENKSFVKKRKA